ncbi:MAG: diacylglycerol kinase family protein [Solobacterium sp.]|nr:diacylglycerol kinase family protein [Solobacterium sp.]
MRGKFSDAFRGIFLGAADTGIRIQYVLALLAVIAGFILRLDLLEWAVVSVCIGSVVASEILNTCVERICDLYTDKYDEKVRYIKDLAAGAVLAASIAALAAAVLILLRRLI